MELSLVYHAGALGDFITTLPAMAAWRRLHSAARIVLLGKSRHGELAPQGLFDEVWETEAAELAPLFGLDLDAASVIGKRFGSFQSALLFSSPSSQLPANLARLGAREIVRQDPFPAQRVPIVDYHLSLFPGLTLVGEDRRPIVRRTRGTLSVPANTVALHPGSGDERKNWPMAKFRQLATVLEHAGFAIRWIMGPAEETLALPEGAQVWRNASLSDVAAALAECRLFVGNDSGITHLAAAAGCLTVALFGASDPFVWSPRGHAVHLIQATGALKELSAETVLSSCLGFLRP